MTYKLYAQKLFLTLLFSLTLISCVTINIYFPAAAAEKVAEQIIDDVLQSDGGSQQKQQKQQKSDNEQSQLNLENYFQQKALLTIVDFFIPTAQAGQADISINTPKIRSIRNSMERRQSKLRPYYQSANVGFTNNGMIASINSKGLSIKQKSSVNKLVKAENNDRKALYKEIASANGHPEWQADIQKTFAKTWINKISSGWMYQSKSGKWLRK